MDLRLNVFLLALCCWMACASMPVEIGMLPPPREVSLTFRNDFCVTLAWRPPQNLNRSTCDLQYYITEAFGQEVGQYTRTDTHFESCLDMERGVNYTIRTQPKNCGDMTDSKDIVRGASPPKEKLVKDFECIYYTSGSMNCTWSPADQTTDLQLYYWYKNMAQPLKPCGLYLYTGGLKTGCHLHGDFLNVTNLTTEVFFLINRTHGPSTLQNKFKRTTRDNMKPFPPKLNMKKKEGGMLELSCDPPSGFDPSLDYWDYTLRYRTSKDSNWKEISPVRCTALVPYDHHFQYRVQVKAICKDICGTGASDWSQEECYGQDQASDWSFHLTLIAIPVVITICVILFLFFLKKLRVLILPQIPDPLKLFKELINSKEVSTDAGSNLMESKIWEKQKVYVPERPELCVDVWLVDQDP
ncbi:hypothetical protein AGOR_G00073470 [Albula goreensis]|uniref:Fibronectin type-III domain-containing protein n=1 Tax=Albula goreensis TaxID=1534307 RepID=A0A8T3DRH6_9TELE|nr:hypothetical protein AGOR_G00073470 [Albula goreensis]